MTSYKGQKEIYLALVRKWCSLVHISTTHPSQHTCTINNRCVKMCLSTYKVIYCGNAAPGWIALWSHRFFLKLPKKAPSSLIHFYDLKKRWDKTPHTLLWRSAVPIERIASLTVHVYERPSSKSLYTFIIYKKSSVELGIAHTLRMLGE